MQGKLFLIGCGPGDSDLLTLKALKVIKQLDVALIDHLLTEEIIALIPSHIEVIYVGKEKGKHSFPQETINTMIGHHARQGKIVGRLKCGDPYIFGRGSEEALYAATQEIPTEVISGISSALAAPAAVGIAPTARGVSTGVSIVSAHLAGDRVNLSWIPLLALPHHTTVVLMGVSRARQITSAALQAGISPTLPVAIVANATSPQQTHSITTLESLPALAKIADKPSLLVFGESVKLGDVLPHYNYVAKEL